MNRYDNGEPITKERIQDEEWYPDYQEVILEFVNLEGPGTTVSLSYDSFVEKHPGMTSEQKTQVLRWIVLHVERHKTLPPRQELIDGYAYYRANSAEKDALNCTSYTQELQGLARHLAEHMTDAELEAYLKEHEDEN